MKVMRGVVGTARALGGQGNLSSRETGPMTKSLERFQTSQRILAAIAELRAVGLCPRVRETAFGYEPSMMAGGLSQATLQTALGIRENERTERAG